MVTVQIGSRKVRCVFCLLVVKRRKKIRRELSKLQAMEEGVFEGTVAKKLHFLLAKK